MYNVMLLIMFCLFYYTRKISENRREKKNPHKYSVCLLLPSEICRNCGEMRRIPKICHNILGYEAVSEGNRLMGQQ